MVPILLDELISRDALVHIMDNLSSGFINYVHPHAILHNVDICSEEAKKMILKEKPDFVFHLAAQADVGRSIQFPKLDAVVNINGTINVLKACQEYSVKK